MAGPFSTNEVSDRLDSSTSSDRPRPGPRIIRSLPERVIAKIAAGEIIERPASVVKELIENAVDAGASSIGVEIEEGGRNLVRVVDDGVGIPFDQLPAAVAPHSTSKLVDEADLFRIGTFGFRGEAVHSIAGVSEFSIISRPADQSVGGLIRVHHGEIVEHRQCGCAAGTQIEARDLFASVPVRRKFLKSKQTEFGHIVETVIKAALARTGVNFHIEHDGRTSYHRPADADLKRTIEVSFSKDIAEALIPIDHVVDRYRVRGYVCRPSVDRPNNRTQYFFVNGRPIRDRSIAYALVEAYRGLLMTGRHAVAFIFFEIPPDDVDVNVHPTKAEVRFHEPNRLFSLLLGAVRMRFLAEDLTSTLEAPGGQTRDRIAERPTDRSLDAGSSSPGAGRVQTSLGRDEHLDGRRRELNDRFTLGSSTADSERQSLWRSPEARRSIPSPENLRNRSRQEQAGVSPFRIAASTSIDRPERASASEPFFDVGSGDRTTEISSAIPLHSTIDQPVVDVAAPDVTAPTLSETVRAIQLHNSYLVVETDEGMLLIDQHALHERILFERLKERIESSRPEMQELLVPEPVELAPAQVGLVLEARETLESLGLRIDEFNARSVIVTASPTLLSGVDLADLVRSIAGTLEETGKAPSKGKLLERLLSTLACKAAVKAGDPLTEDEICSLVLMRHLVEDGHHCPHGRPTLLRFTLKEIEKQFKRI